MEMERCVLTLSYDDIEKELPDGVSLTDDEKRELFERVANAMQGQDVIMESYWNIIHSIACTFEGSSH